MARNERHERLSEPPGDPGVDLGDMPPREPVGTGPTGLSALPGLARVGAELAWHTAGWSVDKGLRGTVRLLRAATSAQSAADLAADLQQAIRDAARDLIDVTDLEQRLKDSGASSSGVARAVASVVPQSASLSVQGPLSGRRSGTGVPAHNGASLVDRGEELIRRSRDVRFEDAGHPAYDRILSELAPDEARILMLLLTKGPQPAVDVRTGGPLGLISSKLIAPGLSMIGARAGLRYVDRVPAYLNNLFRLGLVWFSRETLPDQLRYQVLEAQPDVMAAVHSVRYAKVVRRSIHLTPFGDAFCRACLPIEPAVLESLPEHAAPKVTRREAQPPSLAGGGEQAES
jgi:hypothetical protein